MIVDDVFAFPVFHFFYVRIPIANFSQFTPRWCHVRWSPRKATCDKKASAFKVRQQTRKEVPPVFGRAKQ